MRYRKSGGYAKKVLLVDDRRSQLRSMKKMLKKIGYMAVTVDSAEEAEHILRCGESFSMVITDLKMPWLDGLSFCKKAKLLDPDLKIFALSGFIYAFGISELEDAGFDGIYQKPIGKTQLVKILNGDI
ncbi:MAG: response regulator [Deltaproteobacteria bacterium]|nr:response regulator [Deltaproteobacteria bacterium]